MSNLSITVKAAALAEVNPAAAQLLVDLDNAETSAEVVQALDNYDSSVVSAD